ncbi:MAG: nucleoside triphosphate pyrophosphohydrolase [Cyanobacteria bacterium P01_F01_bin.42]
MDRAKAGLGLALFNPEAILAAETIAAPQIFVSPIVNEASLRSLLEHLQTIAAASWLKVFAIESPEEQFAISGTVSELNMAESSTANLPYPVSLFLEQPSDGNIQPLVDVVAQLRDPNDGCPWDLEQTPQTLTKFILEEAYEVIAAIESRESTAIADELGDLLLQVVLQSQIASESNTFSLAQVTQGITDKMIRRHPHVFGEVRAESVDEIRTSWEEIKAAEQGMATQDHNYLSRKMSKDAKTLPPMLGGLKLAKRAASAGLEWPNLAGVWAKFYEELVEFQEALLIGDESEQLAELGDLLFTLINVARWCRLDPSMALGLTNQKLIQRVQFIESQASKPLREYSPEELDTLWNRAKKKLASGQGS